MDEELGIEPGSELRRVERAVLTADPVLAAPAPSHPLRLGRAPWLLPGDVSGFTGREQQLAQLDKLTAPDTSSTAAVICLISGTPGVGKTALAVHWGHRAREAFPDGQLYVNLRGYDTEQPVPPGEALARLLAGPAPARSGHPLGRDRNSSSRRLPGRKRSSGRGGADGFAGETAVVGSVWSSAYVAWVPAFGFSGLRTVPEAARRVRPDAEMPGLGPRCGEAADRTQGRKPSHDRACRAVPDRARHCGEQHGPGPAGPPRAGGARNRGRLRVRQGAQLQPRPPRWTRSTPSCAYRTPRVRSVAT
nr:AAA family ATPase [Streptomyces poonensis]